LKCSKWNSHFPSYAQVIIKSLNQHKIRAMMLTFIFWPWPQKSWCKLLTTCKPCDFGFTFVRTSKKIVQISNGAWFFIIGLLKLLLGLVGSQKGIWDYLRPHFSDSKWINYEFSKVLKIEVPTTDLRLSGTKYIHFRQESVGICN